MGPRTFLLILRKSGCLTESNKELTEDKCARNKTLTEKGHDVRLQPRSQPSDKGLDIGSQTLQRIAALPVMLRASRLPCLSGTNEVLTLVEG